MADLYSTTSIKPIASPLLIGSASQLARLYHQKVENEVALSSLAWTKEVGG